MQWMKERYARVSALVVCALGLGIQSSTQAAMPESFTIYSIESLTGPGAYFGIEMANAMKSYEVIANKEGGIRGRPVHFEILDDGSNPQVTVQLFNQIAARHAPIVLGPSAQAQCNAVAPLAQSNGPIVYCSSPGLAPPPGFVFSAGAEISHTQHALLKYAHDLGSKRLGVLVEMDATGQRMERLLPITLAKRDLAGMQLVAHEHFAPADISVAAQVAHIMSEKPDFLYIGASGTPFQVVLRGFTDAGVSLPMATSSANMDIKILSPFDKAMPSQLVFNAPRTWINPGVTLKRSGVLGDYDTAYKSAGFTQTPNDDYGWDPAKLAVDAFRKFGFDATAMQIHDYIMSLRNFVGIGGTYDFTAGDQHGLGDDSVIVVEYDRLTHNFAAISKPGGQPLKPSR
jgi:branched-chain amino acid transport system substrate-binding protein